MNKYHLHYQLKDQKGNVIPFTLPYCWEGVSFRQMEKLWELNGIEQHMDESYIVEALTGISREVWNSCQDIDLLFLVNQTLGFTSEMKQLSGIEPSNKFEYNGRGYEVPKDLAIKSIGQYKDLVKFCIEPYLDEANKDDVSKAKTIPLMIAIYMQPIMGVSINDYIGGKEAEYDYSKAKELAESFRDISIIDALRLQAFFFKRSIELKIDIEGSAEEVMKRQKSMQESKRSAKGGGFISRIKRLPKTLFSSSAK